MSFMPTVVGRPKFKVLRDHKFTLTDPDHNALYAEIYNTHNPEDEDAQLPAIQDDEIEALLMLYAEDRDMQVSNFSEALNIPLTQVYKILRSERYADHYQAAKRAKSEMFNAMAVRTACLPFDKMIAGEEVNPNLIKAASLKANVLMTAADGVSPDNSKNSAHAPVKIAVETQFSLGGYFNEKEKEGQTIDGN